MRRIAFLAALLLIPVLGRAADAPLGVMLAEPEGSVWVRIDDAAPWTRGEKNAPLPIGAEVKTLAASTAIISFSNGTKLRVNPKGSLRINEAGSLKTALQLLTGKVECWVKLLSGNSRFQLRHRNAVASVRGTVFAMDVSDGVVKIDLFSGALDVTDSFGRGTSMSPGQTAAVADDGLKGVSALPPSQKAPEEPAVAIPPPPAPDAGKGQPAKKAAPAKTEEAPAEIPAEETTTTEAPPPPSPLQETTTTVSPSSP